MPPSPTPRPRREEAGEVGWMGLGMGEHVPMVVSGARLPACLPIRLPGHGSDCTGTGTSTLLSLRSTSVGVVCVV